MPSERKSHDVTSFRRCSKIGSRHGVFAGMETSRLPPEEPDEGRYVAPPQSRKRFDNGILPKLPVLSHSEPKSTP